MGKETRRAAEMRRTLKEWEASGLSRRVFCEKRGIAVTTFDYWRRELASLPEMVKVEVAGGPAESGFSLLLGNGRRIECGPLGEEELARLIRIAERA